MYEYEMMLHNYLYLVYCLNHYRNFYNDLASSDKNIASLQTAIGWTHIKTFTGNINVIKSGDSTSLPLYSSTVWCKTADINKSSIVPSGVQYFLLETTVSTGSSSIHKQLMTVYPSLVVWNRIYINGAWLNWHQI